MTIQASVKIEDLSSSDIKKSIDTIRNIIINGINDTKKVIFICGKDKSDKESYRFKISQLLEHNTNYQLAYPEDLFEDLLEGQANNSLLSLEQQLAEAVDLIIIIPESPGSFAKGKILDIPHDFDYKNKEHFSEIIKTVKKMIPSGRRSKSINNILLYQNHILLLIYLFDELNITSIHKLMSMVLDKKLTNQELIGCKAAIHSLTRSQFIDKIGNEYILTDRGFSDVQLKYYALNEITNLRISIMNKQL
ncbi:UDP-3-O-(3-hydroxymyristoyl)glucosamine N-acyltransferase [Salmonella enterica]|uniref:UDP-3-O-(3-hydroxymyristoyl)glucosamine N-acyltransferase n=1 Tax=Salmonella enterica TaxID=28901 RepID=UPI000D7602E3|nr:UDP-3-O-(3-hydroxymyristoyl)glucosamine N-acyltransferase [Salmonella enterica]PXO17945.1 UDP-3-O-(3-hydroxymyristoyl)glucosamine N-acyltransferase [Salmonella enterica]